MGPNSQNVLFGPLSGRQVAFDSEILNKLNACVRQDEDGASANSRLAMIMTRRSNEHKRHCKPTWVIWGENEGLAEWFNDCINARQGPEDTASMTLGMG